MAETVQTLFNGSTEAVPAAGAAPSLGSSPLTGGTGLWLDMSQNEKDAIMRQIHPIFLTAHSEEKAPVQQSNFDKFLGFMRLCLEWFLKLVDIVVDAIIQVARLGVWIVAITGVLIVVTLMTNTTDKFIDLLNGSIFKAIGINTRIEKVPSVSNGAPVVIPGITKDANLKSDATISDTNSDNSAIPETSDVSTTESNTSSGTDQQTSTLPRTRRTRVANTDTSTTTTTDTQEVNTNLAQ